MCFIGLGRMLDGGVDIRQLRGSGLNISQRHNVLSIGEQIRVTKWGLSVYIGTSILTICNLVNLVTSTQVRT